MCTHRLETLTPCFWRIRLNVAPNREQLICHLNLLLQHYHTSSMVSHKLDASLKYLQLQLGTNRCPFNLDYDTWSPLPPLSWVKMYWRTIQMGQIDLFLDYKIIPLPREQDVLLMDIFSDASIPSHQLECLNRVRGFLHVLFLLDITRANGKNLEWFASEPSYTPINPSTYSFPREEPTNADWEIWREFWKQFKETGKKLPTPLGPWVHPSH